MTCLHVSAKQKWEGTHSQCGKADPARFPVRWAGHASYADTGLSSEASYGSVLGGQCVVRHDWIDNSSQWNWESNVPAMCPWFSRNLSQCACNVPAMCLQCACNVPWHVIYGYTDTAMSLAFFVSCRDTLWLIMHASEPKPQRSQYFMPRPHAESWKHCLAISCLRWVAQLHWDKSVNLKTLWHRCIMGWLLCQSLAQAHLHICQPNCNHSTRKVLPQALVHGCASSLGFLCRVCSDMWQQLRARQRP